MSEETWTIVDLVVVTEGNYGCEAIYIDGTLVDSDSTIYASDISRSVKNIDNPLIKFSHKVLELPDNFQPFPTKLEDAICIDKAHHRKQIGPKINDQ